MQTIELQLPEKYQSDIEYIKAELEEIKKKFQPKEPNTYLTRSEVAAMLKINLSSLHNWTKKGILISYQLSGRIYYKRKEVEDAIIRLKV